MTTPTRTRTPSLSIEAAVIDAATALLSTEGPEALSIRRIAAAAGVAPMSVYNRFGSKQGVVDALFAEGFVRLDDAINFSRTGNLENDLVTCGRRYRAFTLENPTLYALMFSRAVPDYVPSPAAAAAAGRSFQHLVDHLAWYVEHEVIEDGDPVEIGQRVWEAMHGAMSLELADIGFVDNRAKHTDLLNRTLARGLRRSTTS
jgi:AcrR family transcriptional regulator